MSNDVATKTTDILLLSLVVADGHTSTQPFIQSEKQTRVSGDKGVSEKRNLFL